MKNEKQNRGQLTQRIKQKSKELLGYEITQKELRLFAYIQYKLANEQMLKPEHLAMEDKVLLAVYSQKDWILSGVTNGKGRPKMGEKLSVSKEFWNAMCEIIWLGYV